MSKLNSEVIGHVKVPAKKTKTVSCRKNLFFELWLPLFPMIEKCEIQKENLYVLIGIGFYMSLFLFFKRIRTCL